MNMGTDTMGRGACADKACRGAGCGTAAGRWCKGAVGDRVHRRLLTTIEDVSGSASVASPCLLLLLALLPAWPPVSSCIAAAAAVVVAEAVVVVVVVIVVLVELAAAGFRHYSRCWHSLPRGIVADGSTMMTMTADLLALAPAPTGCSLTESAS